jgi:hypothetical protein
VTDHGTDRWIVFFGPGHARAPLWLRAITAPAWRHCFAVSYDADADRWLLVWPAWRQMHIRIVPAAWIDHWIAEAKTGRLRALQVVANPRNPATLPLAIGCAGMLGWLLGLPGRQLRPQALYRSLLAHGAQERFTDA